MHGKTKSAISGFIKISALVLFHPHITQHPLSAGLISYHSKKSARNRWPGGNITKPPSE